MSEEPIQYVTVENCTATSERGQSIVFVAIPIPMEVLILLDRLSTSATPLENVASLILADAVRAAEANRV